MKLATVHEWFAAMKNVPRCCLSCRHYLVDEWTPTAECVVHKAPPPREWAEEENTCEEWEELVPF